MAEMCVRYPYIGDEESKLYKEVYKYTGKNRKLTNFIYATAQQTWFKQKFSPSDYNSQGELDSRKVIEELEVNKLVEMNNLIADAERILKAVDSTGDTIEYSSINDIIDRVQNFNSSNSNLVAKIQRKGDKYTIQVQPKDDTNFDLYEQYKAGQKQLEIALDKLGRAGFKTTLSDKALLSLDYTNPLDFSEYLPALLGKFQRITGTTYLTNNQVQLLLEFIGPDPRIDKLRRKFGDKTVEALKFLLTGRDTIPENLEDIQQFITTEAKNVFNGLRRDVAAKARNINLTDLKEQLKSAYTENQSEHTKDLKEELKTLYDKWHLDKETIQSNKNKIKTLEDVTIQIITRLEGNIQFLKSKGSITSEEEQELRDQIKEVEKRKAKKEYFNSILGFLNDALDALRDIENLDVDLVDEDSYNEIAGQILAVQNQIKTYAPIIKTLISIDSLEDANDLDPNDLNKIKELAIDVNTQISEIEKQLQDKKFTLVYKYLKERWGEDTKAFAQEGKETLGSFEMSLEEALNRGKISLNFVDRTFLAMTEVSDPVLATFASTIKDLHEVRDDKLREIITQIRRATDKLYKSGGDTSFMFETLSDGTVRIISEIDQDKYEKAKQEYIESIESQYRGTQLAAMVHEWEERNQSSYTPSGIRILKEISGEEQDFDATVIAPNENYRKPLNLTDAQREYYNAMMSLKASMEYNLQRHGIDVDLFKPIQITSEVSETIGNQSVVDTFKALKDNFIDNFSVREDDTQYGNLEVLTDADGHELKSLPTHFMTKLGDQKRVSRNFSRALLAFSAMATNYSVMSEHINSLELAKEFLLERELEQYNGNRPMVGIANLRGQRVESPVVKKTSETSTGEWIQDVMNTKVYGVRHKKSGNIPGTNISIDKTVDVATKYSSVTGLAMNVPGAIANALVGKLQMVIEAGGGEFFGFKDYLKGSTQYWEMLPKLLAELTSNNKTSKLGLLMEKFDVLDDFYDKLRETGFYENGLNKIIGNTSLFFLYGLGEHLLHAQGMLACLNKTKVKNANGKQVPLLDAFEVKVVDGNGELVIKEGYTDLNGRPINDAFIKRQKKVISYVNRSLQGAFGDDEKGLIHQAAFGRLVMNFRQWMPAHYARRFNKLHWDAQLGDFREGYYVTCWKFAGGLLADIKNHQFQLATRYKNLNDMQKANLRRALTETAILVALALISRLGFGDDPKHRTKAEAMAKYEVKRLLMETYASSPLNLRAFVSNIYKTLNEPIAAIAPAQRLTRLFGIDDLIFMRTVQGGQHKGELVYVRNIERAIPFYDQVYKWWHIDTDNSMFLLFNDN